MSLSSSKTGFTAIGECMLELKEDTSYPGAPSLTLGYGGDTLNTSIYMSRLGVPTSYITALGDDPHSDWLLGQWHQEGIDTELIPRYKNRQPGLYWIATDDTGERSFTYWRQESPARQLFDNESHIQHIYQSTIRKRMIYLSGITLSLYSKTGYKRLSSFLTELRSAGGIICFDGNYRPSLWQSTADARRRFESTVRLSDIVLPTFEDERSLFGDQTPQETAARLSNWGVREVAIKLGAQGCLVVQDDGLCLVATKSINRPVDTTAAGDSFNAGYLSARYKGLSVKNAAEKGNELASVVIMHNGAIIPRQVISQLL